MTTPTQQALDLAVTEYTKEYPKIKRLEKYIISRRMVETETIESFIIKINRCHYRVIHDKEDDKWHIEKYNDISNCFVMRGRCISINEKGTD